MSSKTNRGLNKIAILGIGINIAWRKSNNKFNASALYDCLESSENFDVQNFFRELTVMNSLHLIEFLIFMI